MNGAEHYAEAENLATWADEVYAGYGDESNTVTAHHNAQALVHATLAVAAAVTNISRVEKRDGPMPDWAGAVLWCGHGHDWFVVLGTDRTWRTSEGRAVKEHSVRAEWDAGDLTTERPDA